MDGKPVAPITAEQLESLAPWYSQNGRDSRTLALFDAIPKYPFPTTRFVERAERVEAAFTIQGKRYVAEILPAQIKVAGEERLAFPGAREELVERALRFVAVQQIAETKLIPDGKIGRQGITVFFSLSMVRRHLQELGHGYKVSEIREALDILSGTRVRLRIAIETGEKSGEIIDQASILTRYTQHVADGDEIEDSRAAVTFHPLATQAILELAYWPINQTRVGKLKMSLARWLTTRMSHNFRQAQKHAYVDDLGGYHIKLSTILVERGLVREKRLCDNLDGVIAESVPKRTLRVQAQPRAWISR